MNCEECGENVPDNLRLCPDCAIPKHSKSSRSRTETRAVAVALEKQKLQAQCSHKFIDSNHCLKCGWVPPNY